MVVVVVVSSSPLPSPAIPALGRPALYLFSNFLLFSHFLGVGMSLTGAVGGNGPLPFPCWFSGFSLLPVITDDRELNLLEILTSVEGCQICQSRFSMWCASQ
eukprot:1452464-Pyramimonas_sp.AAC.1